MRSRTNLTGAVEGSLVIFDNGYQGTVTLVEDRRVKVSVPLHSGNGVKLNVWLDRFTGREYGFVTFREVKLFPATTPANNKKLSNEVKQICGKDFIKALSDYDRAMTEVEKKLAVSDYSIQKVDKRNYKVIVVYSNNKTQELDKHFKSITAANEWCALHLKTL